MTKSLLHAFGLAFLALPFAASAQTLTTNQNFFEKLDRAVVVSPHNSGRAHIVSWRLLGTDDENTTFEILVNGVSKKKNIADVTNVMMTGLKVSDEIQIVTYQNGEPVETSAPARFFTSFCQQIPTDVPANGVTPSGEEYSYSPNDCSVGDVDGDGEYEIFVKWDPSNSKDNSQSGYTGNVFIDCMKLDGTRIWRIDLGKNIRAGAHYTQFMVYDFDKDGKAEMICKTGPGSIDGTGAFVSEAATDEMIKNADNAKDWRTEAGRVNGGQEWLTAFDGATGRAIHTIFYAPNRNAKIGGSEAAGTYNWDDRSGKNDKGDYGNRGERFLATVAYLDGPDQNASVVMVRGYYTWSFLWAVGFDGKELTPKWLHASESRTKYSVYSGEGLADKETFTAPKNTAGISGSNTAYACGNHNLSCADVDGDGCDEIILGASAIDHDGKLLYSTGLGHGDAIHVSDLIPSHPGLEVFCVHEEGGNVGYGYDIHDAATGEILVRATGTSDNGRGMAADVFPDNAGFEFWSAAFREPRSCETGSMVTNSTKPSMNFRIYWDGSAYDCLLDGTTINSPRGFSQAISNNNSSTCNSTKKTPCLQADILGDWREEVILWDSQTKALNLFITRETSDFRLPTLMHDHVYRLGVAWQNVAYNQPPHLGYYLPGYLDGTGPASLSLPLTDQSGVWSVFNLAGVCVARHRFSSTSEIPTTLSLLPSLPSGIYILKVESAAGTISKRITK